MNYHHCVVEMYLVHRRGSVNETQETGAGTPARSHPSIIIATYYAITNVRILSFC